MANQAQILALCSAAKTALNEHGFSRPFTAVVAVRPIVDLVDLDDLYVAVVPRSWKTQPATLDGIEQHALTIEVHVRKKLLDEDQSELEGLVNLAEDIRRFLQDQSVEGNAWCTDAEVTLGDSEQYQLRQFTAVIEANYEINA